MGRAAQPHPPAEDLTVQVDPVITGIEAAVAAQLALSAPDPAVEGAASLIMAALQPALRQAAITLAEQAAGEVSAQLGDRRVEVTLVDGDPVLRVTEPAPGSAPVQEEEFDARITLRLPPSLKSLVEAAADESGDSINAWVVKALSSRAHGSGGRGKSFHGTFDL